jgi:hypothetical protein
MRKASFPPVFNQKALLKITETFFPGIVEVFSSPAANLASFAAKRIFNIHKRMNILVAPIKRKQ